MKWQPLFSNEALASHDYHAGILRIARAICLALALLVLLPSTLFALHEGLSLFVEVQGAAILAFLFLVLLGQRWKASIFYGLPALSLLMGTFFVYHDGIQGLGPLWLAAAIVMAAVFVGARGSVAAAGYAFALFVALALTVDGAALGLLGTRRRLVGLGVGTAVLGLASSLPAARIARFLDHSVGARDRLRGELAARESALEAAAAQWRGAEKLASFYRNYDPLTKLPNRPRFLSELSVAMRRAGRRERSLAVICVGLDRFSRLADSFGEAVGDSLLLALSSSLRAAFRDDDIVARTGDRLFAIACTDLREPGDLRGLVEKTRAVMEKPFLVEGGTVRLRATMGIAQWPGDAEDAAGLLHAAESALRLARETGPGSFRLFDSRAHGGFVDRLRLESEFETAIGRGEIIPWFQPKVDRFGRIVGAEALARWRRPDGSMRQPSEFIALAEGSGHIAELGRTILERSCEAAAAWALEGLAPIPVSVNLSPLQFRCPDFALDLRNALLRSGLDPARLELEITESGIVGSEDEVVDRLAQLKCLGVSLSIDDFGTGMSSIARLRDFPVDAVKVPKSFVDPLPADSRASTVARAVIELAHNLDFEVVAEGVEDEGQYDWLRGAGCDLYQGYLFGRPMPEAEFRLSLARSSATVVE